MRSSRPTYLIFANRPGYELENVKREKGYAKAKTDMEELRKSVFNLAKICHAYYDKRNK